MASQLFIKDPDAVLDYVIDWDDWLGTDTIATSTWAAEAGITIDSDTNTNTTATVWLSSGTAGTEYIVTNEIVTAASRTDNRRLRIRVEER